MTNPNPEFDPEKEARNRFELMIKAWTNGVESEWKNFKDADLYRIAKDTNSTIVGWYNRVYRPACEPAHMTDLSEFMPLDSIPFNLKPQPSLTALKSLIAIDHGLRIILDLLGNVAEIFELGFEDTIVKLKADFELVRDQPA